MPQSYAADLSSMAQVAQNKAQHGVAASKHGKTDPALCPTDQENSVMPKTKTKTFSWDYAWRSGVAGGVAGCAVSQISPAAPDADTPTRDGCESARVLNRLLKYFTNMHILGQNPRRTA